MAAAALSRSRGVAGVTPKGLFSIFTLLCLVCLSSSLTHKDQLTEQKKKVQKLQNELDEAKAKYKPEMGTAVDLVGLSLSVIESLEAFMEKNEEAFHDFPHLQGFVQCVKGFVESVKNTVDEMDVKMRAQIKNMEQELEREKSIFKFLEEQQAEL